MAIKVFEEALWARHTLTMFTARVRGSEPADREHSCQKWNSCSRLMLTVDVGKFSGGGEWELSFLTGKFSGGMSGMDIFRGEMCWVLGDLEEWV